MGRGTTRRVHSKDNLQHSAVDLFELCRVVHWHNGVHRATLLRCPQHTIPHRTPAISGLMGPPCTEVLQENQLPFPQRQISNMLIVDPFPDDQQPAAGVPLHLQMLSAVVLGALEPTHEQTHQQDSQLYPTESLLAVSVLDQTSRKRETFQRTDGEWCYSNITHGADTRANPFSGTPAVCEASCGASS